MRANAAWVAGVAAVIALTYITLNTLRTEGRSSRGVTSGQKLPPFAAPFAVGGEDADANVAVEPDSGAQGARPACDVRGPRILNVCELSERGPLALAFFAIRSRRCEDQVDVLERAARSVPGVQVAAVAVRGKREDVASAVRARGWRMPVGWDRDGAVANLYSVALCPTITFVGSDGRVKSTALRFLDERALRDRLSRLR